MFWSVFTRFACFLLRRFYFCFYWSSLFLSRKFCFLDCMPNLAAWRHLSAYHLLDFKVKNILNIEKFYLLLAVLFFGAYTISLNLIFLSFEAKNERYCILLRQMKLQQRQSITLAFTAAQYCFKQQEQICLQTISHKLDSKDQILYFSIYARWSLQLVGVIDFICLSVWLLKHRGFL